MNRTVGFIGLGAMGCPMAINLARHGFPVVAWNRSPGPLRNATDAGLRAAKDPAEIAEVSRTVVTMLPDLPQVRAVLDGEGGLLAANGVLDTLVVMGTVSPVGVRALAEELAPKGIELLDAPVSGGETGARDARLSIMVGGEVAAFERLRPILEAMGTTVRRMGPIGSGSLMKACNQMVVAGTLAALAEAVVLGERGGLDPGVLLDVLGGGLAASEVLNQKRNHLASGDFRGSGPTRYLVKDLGFVSETAQSQHTVLPATATVAQLYLAAVAQGLGDLDNSAVLDVVRRLAQPRPVDAS